MDKEYIPYGPEWEKEMMRMTKNELIAVLRGAFQANASQHKCPNCIFGKFTKIIQICSVCGAEMGASD